MSETAGKLKKLFLTTLYISTFTFGGGFVIISLMKKKFVDEYRWITENEMLDMAAIAQSCPGAIAVNAAIMVGYRTAGLAGVAASVLGTILPPLVILSVISLFYAAFRDSVLVSLMLKGMQAGVAAVVLDVACNLGQNVAKQKSILQDCIMGAAFACTFFLNVNVVYLILAAAGIGLLRAFSAKKGGLGT